MDITELREKASALRVEKQSLLNDTFFWAQLAKEAVGQLPDTKFKFEVPKAGSSGKMRTVSRNHPDKLKERILKKDIYNSAFVSMVAAMEDYLSKIMTWILLADHQRIKCTISGINFSKDVAITDLIDKDMNEIIEDITEQRVASLFYARPEKQLEYFDKALGLKVNEEIWGKWIEIKARRDLWIHNSGIVNQVYLSKTGDYHLYEAGDEAIITEQYFNDCVATLKTMIGRMDRDIRKQYPEP